MLSLYFCVGGCWYESGRVCGSAGMEAGEREERGWPVLKPASASTPIEKHRRSTSWFRFRSRLRRNHSFSMWVGWSRDQAP